MSGTEQMPNTRRRAIPGMVSHAVVPAPEPIAASAQEPEPRPSVPSPRSLRRVEKLTATTGRSTDYSVTRLVNFRLPVDLHDRFRGLVTQAEERHPRLRKASLTELVIALLEEGPRNADEVAELIRRKRLAENEEG